MDDMNIHLDELVLDPGEIKDQGTLSATIQRRMLRPIPSEYSHQVADAVAGSVCRVVSEANEDNSNWQS
jgi:hypothetical protein